MIAVNDDKNRTWKLILNLATVKQVLQELNVNLLDPLFVTDNGVNVITRLMYDDLFLCDVCAVLLSKQFEYAKIDKNEFYNDVSGATVQKLSDAFFDEYRFFFEERGKNWLVKAINKDLANKQDQEKRAEEGLTGEKFVESQEERA